MKRIVFTVICIMGVCNALFAESFDSDIALLKQAISKDSVHARHFAENLLKKDKKNPDLAAAIGTTFLHANRLEDAEYFYDKGYHMYRISTTVINLAGDIALAKNDRQQAEYYYGRAMYFNKRDPEAYFKYAKLYTKKDPDKAIQKLKVLRCYRHEPEIDLKMAEVYYDSNRFSDAANVYASLPVETLGKEELTSYALSYYFQQKFDSALVVTRRAIERFPRHPAFNRMLLYNNTELKRYDDAMAAANKLFYHSDNAEFQYLDYIYYGYALNGRGHFDQAIAQFNKVLELNKDRKDVIKAISEAYEKIGDYDHAITYYRQYVDKMDADEKTPFEEFHIGNLFYAKGTDEKKTKELTAEKIEALRQADAQFEKVEQMRPDSYLGAYWRARTNVALDPETEKGLAKPHYMKVIDIITSKGETSPQLMESYKYLAYYYYRKHDKDSCLIYVDKIMEIDPMDSYALQISNAL